MKKLDSKEMNKVKGGIFVGYQLASAHKRITDVAPVIIGGLAKS